ncbi:sensor histidine kinase [bacterium]|nr:sensor histidine kinase [bacterium]
MSLNDRSLKLVLSLRWIAIACQALALFPALKLGWLQTHTRIPAILIIAFLALLNALSFLAHKNKFIRPTQGYILTQLGFDLFALCGLLWLSGGAWNPFISLLFFHAGLAALLLQGLYLLLFVMLLLWSMTALYSNPLIPPPALGQTLPSLVLYPAHTIVLLSLIGLIAWVSLRLESKRKEIEAAKDELQRLDHLRAFGVIATGFSHEFATPLSTLQMRLKRLQRRSGELESDDDLKVALEAAHQCENKVKNLLKRRDDLANCTFEKVDISSQLRELKEAWVASDVSLVIELPEQPIEIRTPLSSLKQVIADLLENARQACPTGVIKMSARSNDIAGVVELQIEDQGPGVPLVIREHLGEPFFTTRDNGNGLGLYNAVTFAKAMGGLLQISDRPEGGAKITLQLPILQPEKA